jgi:hypothetical protein
MPVTCGANCTGDCDGNACKGNCYESCSDGCYAESYEAGGGSGTEQTCGSSCMKDCGDCGEECGSACRQNCGSGCSDRCSGCGRSCSGLCSNTCKDDCSNGCENSELSEIYNSLSLNEKILYQDVFNIVKMAENEMSRRGYENNLKTLNYSVGNKILIEVPEAIAEYLTTMEVDENSIPKDSKNELASRSTMESYIQLLKNLYDINLNA